MTDSQYSTSFLLPAMSQSGIPFLSAVGDELTRRGCDVTYVPQNKSYILRDAKKILDTDRLELLHVDSSPESSFEDLLTKYGIDSPRSLVFPQMVYDYGYPNIDHQPFLTGSRKPDYEPYFDLLHCALDTFDRLFEDGSGGIPLQHQGAEILRRALQRVADAHDVQSVWTGFSPLNGHCGLYDDEFVDWETFDPSYDVTMTDEQRQAAQEYTSRVRGEKPLMSPTGGDPDVRSTSAIVRTKNRLQRLLASENDSKEMLVRWFKYKSRRAGKRIKRPLAERIYLDKEESRRIVDQGRYVFFPLQYVRESRITVRSPPYYDLTWLIEYLSRSLPYGYELVVKDHPRQVGALPVDSMRAIARYAHAIDPAVNAHRVIENADAIVTINNTVGYEALIHGKPAVVLGSAFYDGAGYAHTVDDINSLPGILADAIDSGGLSEEDVLTFVHRIIDGSYSGIWNEVEDGNVEILVDSIFEFCSIDRSAY